MACKAPFPWQNQLGRSAQRLDEYANRFWIGRSVPFDLPVEAGQVKGGGEWYASLLAQTELRTGRAGDDAAPDGAGGGDDRQRRGGAGAVRRQRGSGAGRGHDDAEPRHRDARAGDLVEDGPDRERDDGAERRHGLGEGSRDPGRKVGGKTGTAEAGAEGSTPHSWFIGYAPADDPRVAIAVIMEHKGSGTDFATPAARAMLQRALEVYKR